MSTKKCLKCEYVKSLSEYGRMSCRKDKLHYYCKSCIKDINAVQYAKNQQERVARAVSWARNNRGRKRELNKEYMSKHPEVRERSRHKRRAQLAGVEYDRTILLDKLYLRDGEQCSLCNKHVKRGEASIDHITPISCGGTHTWDNIQLAHIICNCAKGNSLSQTEPAAGTHRISL